MASTRDDLNFFFFKEGTCQEDVERIGVVNFCFKILKKKEEITERKRYESKENSGKQRGREKANNKGTKKIIRERKNRIEKWIYLGLLHSNVL